MIASTSKTAFAAAALAMAAMPAMVRADASDASFAYNQQPNQPWQDGQVGKNNCVANYGASSDTSMCQTAIINSADDFCLWAPPTTDTIANTERYEVAYCTKSGYGTRLIPDGTLTGVHFTKAPNYVQVIAIGDFTKINVAANDDGGELDPHGADGNGNPEGSLVYSASFGLSNGQPQQIHEWMSFMSSNQACFRACFGGTQEYQKQLCQHIYDVMGCAWVMPSTKYSDNSFDSCDSENGDPPGIYNNYASTWYQGDPPCAACAPAPHPPPATSNCQQVPSIRVGAASSGGGSSAASSTSSASTSATTSASSSAATATTTSSMAPSSSTSTVVSSTTSLSSVVASGTSLSNAAATSLTSRPNGAAADLSGGAALTTMAIGAVAAAVFALL